MSNLPVGDTRFLVKGFEMSTVLDPFDAATEAGNRSDAYFGRMEIDAQFIVLKKGERKRAWVEGDDLDGRSTEVTIRLNPLDVTGLTRMIERNILAESREWSATVWASLRDLGIKNVREVHGKWAHVELVKSGRSWKNKDGEDVQGTTFKFVGLFDSEADCVKAWESAFGSQPSRQTGTAPGVAAAPANDAEKQVAAQFLPALVKGANGDLTALATILASMSPVNKYFTVDSVEVQALLKAA